MTWKVQKKILKAKNLSINLKKYKKKFKKTRYKSI